MMIIDSDMNIVIRDLLDAKLPYTADHELIASKWAVLLFGNKFSHNGRTSNRRTVRHILKYIRTTCTCLHCLIKHLDTQHQQSIHTTTTTTTPSLPLSSSSSDIPFSTNDTAPMQTALCIPNYSVDGMTTYTSQTSAYANFVRAFSLPSIASLHSIGAVESDTLLQLGTIVRLQSRSASRLNFTDHMRSLFSHLSYSGPWSHETLYRNVTTIGVNYYQFNKGLKNRHVFIRGKRISLPIEMGIVKLGTRPLRLDELGSTHILYRRQIMHIYIGQIVLQGNVPDS